MFFDITSGDEPAGRVVIGLYAGSYHAWLHVSKSRRGIVLPISEALDAYLFHCCAQMRYQRLQRTSVLSVLAVGIKLWPL